MPKKIHKCDVCKKAFIWDENSRSYGSLAHEDGGYRTFLTCSNECRENSPSPEELDRIIGRVKPRGYVSNLVGSDWESWDNREETNA